MQRVGFSRSVVVKEWPARHCFVSLPHHWASMTLPAPTPTFCLETSQSRTLVLSWAGDIHNPSAGSDSTVLVSREVLKDSGISDGEVGVLTQIQVPPPCTMITVIVGSLTQWQDLALNAEVAQSAILSQVRVIGLRQCVPLWLEGGACVFLTVTSLDPPLKYGTLQPMTQVEVLPPLEKDGSHDYKAINFTPTSVESDSRSEEFDSSQKVVIRECNKNVVDESKNQEEIQKQNSFKENMFAMILSYIYKKHKAQKSVHDLPVRRDIQLGYRVVPVPEELNSSFSVGMLDHPSLIIISRESLLYTCLKNEVSFIGHLRKINSYKENDTISNASSEKRSNEIEKQDSKSSGVVLASCLCTVIVWENFIVESDENVDFVKKISALLKVNNCVAVNCLRRLMKLSTLSVVELQTSDVTVKTVPVTIDVLPLTPLDASCALLLADTVKSQLKNLADEYTVIINQKTLMEININGKRIDVFITTRDGVPLKLDNKSVVLLEVTLLKQHASLPYIHSSVSDLNRNYHAKFPYVGYEGVFSNLKQHVLLTQGCQTDFCDAGPQFALLHGSKGSGKTSLVESLIGCLSTYPYYMHADMVSCKQLKGKKMQTVEKKLQLIFREAIFKRPSIIILDDIDHLVPSQGSQDQDTGPVYEHTMQMVSMITGLLDQLVDFICDAHFPLHSHNPKSGSVIVIATCITRASVHPLLVNPQGCHWFPCTFGIPPLEAEGRVKALNGMLQAHMKKYICHKRCLQSNCVKSCPEDTGTDKGSKADEDPWSRSLQIDAKLITRLTESFVLPDLNHLALRTFLQAKHRWGCKVNEKVSKSKTKAKIFEQINLQHFPEGGTNFSESSAQTQSSDSDVILNVDVEAALEGYIPLALRGLALSEKKSTVNLGVGGLAEASRILEETLTWPSMYPNLFSKITLRLRSGVLLYGPPGCGKTLLANTVTANCSLNLISVKGPELLSKYIGASEEAVRNAFERASSAKPCVLFFDEFESIAPRRGHDSTGVTDRVVNQLLTQMDGVEGLTGVYILAATSRPDLIDPALLRPGRLDKCVFCPIPSLSDREEILQVLSEAVELGEDVDWSQVARSTENFTGADLQSVLSTAQVLVAQEALGDNLYKGVIQSDQSNNKDETTYTTNPFEQAKLNKGDKSLKLAEEHSIVHKKEMDTGLQHALLEEVIIEKEIEKVTFSQKRFSVQKDYNLVVGNENEDTTIQVALVAEKLECDKPLEYNASDCDLPGKLELKVFKRHIDAALKEVKPSVTQAERLKYEHLYATFTKSKDGSFGHPSPGKRATLA